MIRLGSSFLVALALTIGMAAPASAGAILVGDTVQFDLLDTGFGDFTDTRTINAAGDGIDFGDGSNIGDLMYDGEFIHVFETSIEFSLFGGGSPLADPNASYLTTGFDPSARYVLSGLFDPGVAEITGVSISLSDVFGVALGSEVLFDAHSVTLLVGTLGILQSASNLGTVTLNLTLRDLTDPGPGPAPIPEPSTLALLGSGVAAAWMRRRRAAGRSTRLS